MDVVRVIAFCLHFLLLVYFYLLWARVVLDFIRQVRREWKPKGFWLIVSVVILRTTDPGVRFARRFIRPVRIMGAQVDVAMFVLMLTLLIAMAALSIVIS